MYLKMYILEVLASAKYMQGFAQKVTFTVLFSHSDGCIFKHYRKATPTRYLFPVTLRSYNYEGMQFIINNDIKLLKITKYQFTS